MSDNVNHPAHYAREIECIDAMLQCFGVEAVMHFCCINAFKYLWRHKRKNGFEDIKKWYLDKYCELDGKNHDPSPDEKHDCGNCTGCDYYGRSNKDYPCCDCSRLRVDHYE